MFFIISHSSMYNQYKSRIMKRFLFFALASVMFVACGSNQGTPDVIVETPLENADFVLVENQTKGLCGLRFSNKIKEWYPDIVSLELLPAVYKDIEILYGGNEYAEIKATDANGVVNLIRTGFDYRTLVAEYVTVATGTAIEVCSLSRYSDGDNFYLMTGNNTESLLRIRPCYFCQGEFGTITTYGPYEEIEYNYDSVPYSYIFKQNGKYGVGEMQFGYQRDGIVIDAAYDDIIMYNMYGSFQSYFDPEIGFYGSPYMGGDFFFVKQEDGSYLMTTGDKNMNTLCKLSAEEVAAIRSEAGVADDARIIATSFFPENRIWDLYEAGKKISTRFWN